MQITHIGDFHQTELQSDNVIQHIFNILIRKTKQTMKNSFVVKPQKGAFYFFSALTSQEKNTPCHNRPPSKWLILDECKCTLRAASGSTWTIMVNQYLTTPTNFCCALSLYSPQYFLSFLYKQVIFQIPKMASEEAKSRTTSFVPGNADDL